jgi:acetyl-CoA carboxylase biotin carboxyl carrier protein
MTLEEIEQLTAHCARAGIGEIELAQAGFSLRLRIDAPVALDAVTPVEMPKSEAAFSGVRAPGVGVFRVCHPATGLPVAESGSAVRKNQTVGVLEIGSYLKAVIAPADGVLGEPLAEDGAVVGYGAPLYALL